jgi:hypothetical protein
MAKSASQRKPAPRKTVPQQPEPTTSKKGGSGQSQSSKSKQGGSKPPQGKGQPVAKKRSTVWTIVLALVSIGAVIDAIIPLLYRRETYEINHPIVLGGAILVGLLGLAGVIGLWLWKRWGLYLFVASVIGSIGVGLVIYPSMIVAFHALIPLLVLGYGLARDNTLAQLE